MNFGCSLKFTDPTHHAMTQVQPTEEFSQIWVARIESIWSSRGNDGPLTIMKLNRAIETRSLHEFYMMQEVKLSCRYTWTHLEVSIH